MLAQSPLLQADWGAGMDHSGWFLCCPLCRSIFLAATTGSCTSNHAQYGSVLILLPPGFGQFTFCLSAYPGSLQLLQFTFPPSFLLEEAALSLPCLWWAAPRQDSSGTSHSSSPSTPWLSFPFPINQLSSLCCFISDHICSSEFAHWVFREGLHFPVLVFKSYGPSGAAERQLR